MSLAFLVDPRLRRLAFVAWWLGWVAVFAATLSPQPELPLGFSDKVWHVLGFAAMAVTAVGFAHEIRHLAGWAAFTLLMGGLVEIGQGFVPTREPDLHDFAADGVGVVLGVAVASCWLAAVIWPLRRRLRPA